VVRERHLRADAQRNLDRILVAAREVFREQGPDAPLDEIARRASVGIATLYRRFPDRQALARGVALDVWRRVADEAWLALDEEPTAFRALARYLHRALDLGIGAVMPLVVGQVNLDDETNAARDQSIESVQRILAAAQAEGTLRRDVAFGDMGLLLIRLNRPLPGPFPRALDRAISHRHLDLLLAGLRAHGAPPVPLPGPALTLDNLLAISGE
jgi:AcrR family transcriptional regulator